MHRSIISFLRQYQSIEITKLFELPELKYCRCKSPLLGSIYQRPISLPKALLKNSRISHPGVNYNLILKDEEDVHRLDLIALNDLRGPRKGKVFSNITKSKTSAAKGYTVLKVRLGIRKKVIDLCSRALEAKK